MYLIESNQLAYKVEETYQEKQNIHCFKELYAANPLVVSDLTLDHSFMVKLGWVRIKVLITLLLLVLEVCNVQSTFRKSYAVNLLAVSDLTLDLSFKVKLGRVRIKVPVFC